MKVRHNILRYASLLLVGCMLVGYAISLWLRTAEIAAFHTNDNFSDVLVTNFPLTDKGKINWWLANKDKLSENYDIPSKSPDSGHFSITFWDFSDGYKNKEKYDRLCFSEMKTDVNCIEKDAVLIVSNNRTGSIFFTVNNGRYMIKDNGDIMKLKGW
ncbi:DUF943 family protein [Serratia rubidaea]|uniref:DUF943 family protein n=1 Tax=Serratia rubidaea TaxID=61652 RepID=UPI0023B030BD|nr:DUF943 family protein [Serratia rubidaea]MDK1703784.1 DUF943 family protein [Serratia rubidaea]